MFKDVWKAFGALSIFEGVDLTVRRGETLVVAGGSGTGKSVLLKCLLHLLTVDRGSITAFGEEITSRTEAQMRPLRSRIGMLFQGGALFDSINVYDNVAYPLRQAGETDEQVIGRRVSECLELVNMPGIERKWPAELSGGMQKRVGLARAIAIEPEVILYDEPTTGLDPTNVRNIDNLIRSMQRRLGVTSIVVTHDMASAFRVADRIALLWDRKILWAGSRDDVDSTAPEVVRGFVHGTLTILSLIHI